MYNFTGCPCSVCGKTLTDQDDIVVCPDCGAPYHRACYQQAGACVNAAKHGSSFEWTPPASAKPQQACPVCGTSNPADAVYCNHCGRPLQQEAAAQQSAQERTGREQFDYDRFYQAGPEQAYRRGAADARAFGAGETIDGISCAEWDTYLGPSAGSYMRDFTQMDRYGHKTSICFSALLFGPLYFFYRKAWKPAFAFLAIEVLLNVPVLLELLMVTESSLAPNLSVSALTALSYITSIAGFILTIVRAMYAKYFYRRSAVQRIRQIQSAFPDTAKRDAVLRAQGGVSWAAVIGAIAAVLVLSSAFTLLLGPNLNALFELYA